MIKKVNFKMYFVKTLSKLCQKLVKINIDNQIVTEIIVKTLSKTCQKLVKKNTLKIKVL